MLLVDLKSHWSYHDNLPDPVQVMDVEQSRPWPKAENDRISGEHTKLDGPDRKQREDVQFMLCCFR